MKNEAKNYTIELLGDHYSLVSDESEVQVTKAVSLVNALMVEIAQKIGKHDVKKIAVLTALRIASDKVRLDSILDSCIQKETVITQLIEQTLRSS